MANLLEIAEVVYRRINPNPNIQTANKLEEYIATAKSEFGYQMWKKSKEDKRSDEFTLPSYLVSMDEIVVINGKADISHLKPLKSLDADQWLVNIGGFNCECKYMKSDINMAQLMCDDDAAGVIKIYIPIGHGDKDKSQLVFPRGAHKDKLPIYYISNGIKVDDSIEIDDAMAAVIRRYLFEFYGNPAKEDVTKNSNPNN